jgi:integrase
LLTLKNSGKADSTLKTTSQKLNQLGKATDLMNPKEVLTYIANHGISNAGKQKLADCYEHFCKANGIELKKPRYKCEETIPIIPTTENVSKIISACRRRYATIFAILAETGLEGMELHKTPRKRIDTEQGIISVEGHKGHASGTYRLKASTADMLREYLAKNPQEYPFPKPDQMSDMWRKARDKLADYLKQPELRNIPMKNLRNYSGAKLYYTTRDPIAVMRHLRHKKLETTMHYIRGITLDAGEEEYTTKTVQLGTPTTIKEITELSDAGYQYYTDADGYKLFRKRK